MVSTIKAMMMTMASLGGVELSSCTGVVGRGGSGPWTQSEAVVHPQPHCDAGSADTVRASHFEAMSTFGASGL